jgi:hypothetical protein
VNLRLLFFCLLPGLLIAGDLQTIKPEIGPPVIQELMGGCSLRCAFPWTVEIPRAKGSGKKAIDYATNDSDASTAWVDDNPAGSIGTKLIFRFPTKLPKELQETPFYGIDVVNGFIKTEELWKQYARIKKARISYNGRPLFDLVFKDTGRWQKFNFDDLMIKSGDEMTLEILEIYPCAQDQHAAVTEIVLQGAH